MHLSPLDDLHLAITVPLTANRHGDLYLYLSIAYTALVDVARGETGVDWRKTPQQHFAQ